MPHGNMTDVCLHILQLIKDLKQQESVFWITEALSVTIWYYHVLYH